MKKKSARTLSLKGYLQWPLYLAILMVILAGVAGAISVRLGLCAAAFVLVYLILALWFYFSGKKRMLSGIIGFAKAYEASNAKILKELMSPCALVDQSGHFLWINNEFEAVLSESSGRIRSLTAMFPEISKEVLRTGGERVSFHSAFTDKKYRVDIKELKDESLIKSLNDNGILKKGVFIASVCLFDETQILLYEKQIRDEKMVAGLIYLDNYDEAMETVEEVRRSMIAALIDRKINNYISSMGGIVKSLEKDKYFFVTERQYMDRIIEERFTILEDVKTVNLGNAISVTLSIGIGMDGGSYIRNYEYARNAIDVALGRGGDQAVVKIPDNTMYFGGKAQQLERTTRVRVRVKANALKEQIAAKDHLLIMGHRLGDIDSLGSSIGIYRIAMSMNKRANIVLNEITSSIRPMVERFKQSGEYPEDMFIKGEKARELVDDSTLLVVVDVNRPSITDEPSLLRLVKTVVVIDHHRKGSETIEKAELEYVEAYASSACEMVAEMLQYIGDGIRLKQYEADAMYAGIVVDTQNFTNQSGVRTFEAAAYLRRSGADITRVRKMFRDSLKNSQAKAEAVRSAELYRDVFAISVCPSQGLESPTIVGAQAANELLQIEDIKASIVLTEYNGMIYFSARSIDEVNVQVMMEKLGGGGHRAIAGAQMEKVSVADAILRLKAVIDQMVEQGDVS